MNNQKLRFKNLGLFGNKVAKQITMKTNLIFLGHASNIQRLVDVAKSKYEILGIVDSNYFGNTESLNGLPIIGSEEEFDVVLEKYKNSVFFVVPTLRNSINWQNLNPRRQRMIEEANKRNLNLINLIHPTAVIPETTKLGKNIFIGPYTVLQNYVTLEDYVFVKEQVCLAHDCIIKTNANLSSQVYIGSHVTIGENSLIGIKSAIISHRHPISIGRDCTTHPGTIVMKNLPDNTEATMGGKLKGIFSPITISG